MGEGGVSLASHWLVGCGVFEGRQTTPIGGEGESGCKGEKRGWLMASPSKILQDLEHLFAGFRVKKGGEQRGEVQASTGHGFTDLPNGIV